MGAVGDLAVVVGEQIGQLGEVDLGSGFVGEAVESAPPVLELLLLDFGAVLGGSSSGFGQQGGRP